MTSFLEGNMALMAEKQYLNASLKEEDLSHRNNHFPYTHGDLIEN
jgi:hypothetical protein